MPDTLSSRAQREINEILERKGFGDPEPRQESYPRSGNIPYNCVNGHRLMEREGSAYCTKCMNNMERGTFYPSS